MEILQFLRDSASGYPCPSCRASLAGCGIELLRNEGDLHTVEVTCTLCKVVFVVVLRLEFDTDAEALTTKPSCAISGDEVLDVHEALANLAGPITALFSEPSER